MTLTRDFAFRVRALTAIAGILLMLDACDFARKQEAERHVGRPNVLILSVESFRADHLGAAGYDRPITPVLDELASSGVFFERAYAQVSWTRPSVVSTFSSLYQGVHRVMGEVNKKKLPAGLEDLAVLADEKYNAVKLADDIQTLAEMFQAQGYSTHALVGTKVLWKGFGVGQGFDEYGDSYDDRKISKRLDEIFREKGGEPFFVFAHFQGPHMPYDPEERFRMYDQHPEGVDIGPKNLWEIRRGALKLSPQDVSHNIALYDGEIQEVDQRIGRVLRSLEQAGLSRDTVKIVMSDHGEEFYEYKGVGHGTSLHEEVIHVPLIMSGPGFPRDVVVGQQVQNIDIYPTLATLIFGSSPDALQGNNLLELVAKGKDEPWAPAFSEQLYLHAVIQGDWKYVYNSVTEEENLYRLGGARAEAKDHSADPEYNEVLADLRDEMQVFLRENAARAVESGHVSFMEVPDEVVERVKALGYLR